MELNELLVHIVVILILIVGIVAVLMILNNEKIKKTEKKELVPIVNKEIKDKIQYTPKLIDPNIYDNRKLYEEYYEQFGTHVNNSTPIFYHTSTYIKPKRHRRYYRNHR